MWPAFLYEPEDYSCADDDVRLIDISKSLKCFSMWIFSFEQTNMKRSHNTNWSSMRKIEIASAKKKWQSAVGTCCILLWLNNKLSNWYLLKIAFIMCVKLKNIAKMENLSTSTRLKKKFKKIKSHLATWGRLCVFVRLAELIEVR